MKQVVENLLSLADVKINGNNPWDMKVHNPRLYKRILSGGSLALGESYMDGWWDCDAIDQLFDKIFSADLDKKIKYSRTLIWSVIKAKMLNLQSKKRAYHIGKHHYDIGNDLYQNMLDKRMCYSCGYWKDAKNLDQAQEAKLDLICRKVGLKPGMTVLDIGCGWGNFAKYAAEKYGARVVGVTVSKEQVKLAQKLCANLPVEIRLQDYRNVKEKFDRIISIGMFEHVGCKNHKTFMKVVHRCLNDDGIFLLHTIGKSISGVSVDPWIGKYIFPNSLLPSPKQITTAAEGLFTIEDWHNFGSDYDKTLMVWHKNFTQSWDKIKKNYDQRFYRMWKYYLLVCAAIFRSRNIQLWQIVLSKKGVLGGYKSIR